MAPSAPIGSNPHLLGTEASATVGTGPRNSATLIAIVNYRTPDLTLECLRSLVGEVTDLSETRVMVVDNGSGDGSVERIRKEVQRQGWGQWAEVLGLARNVGFAGGNNAVIGPVLDQPGGRRPEFVLLLNPDTVVRPGAVGELLAFMQARPTVGIVGCRLESPDGSPQCSAFRFPTFLGEVNSGFSLGPLSRLLHRHVIAPPVRDEPHRTHWVSGACMLVRGEVFEQVGLLDAAYFMYYEEVDFCLRAARAGWECWYVPAARVVHLVGQSSGVTSAAGAARRLPKYWFDSRRRYFQKNHGRVYALATELAWLAGHLTWRLRRVVQRKAERPMPGRVLASLRWVIWPLVKVGAR